MTGPTYLGPDDDDLVPNRTRRPIRLSLAELLEAYAEAVLRAGSNESLGTIEHAERDRDAIRLEILRRFDRG